MKCTVCISLKCTNNLEIIARTADVLNVPFAMLVGYAVEPEIDVCDECYEILPEEVPMGDSVEDRRVRNRLIRQFYYQWMRKNEEKKVFNMSLNDYIYQICLGQ